ncbi:MAG: type II toxin-antitoxin system RelB/DinJ family antitoxin [bacterium]|nr:type II toxin-antitoxin system RelB/DinJ family antitoxin [bacterium]
MDAVINFKTDKRIKDEAQRIAGEMGLNLSDILNIYLRGFVKKKELYISLNENETNPSDELLIAVEEFKKEYEAGKMKRFKSVDNLIEHLEKL